MADVGVGVSSEGAAGKAGPAAAVGAGATAFDGTGATAAVGAGGVGSGGVGAGGVGAGGVGAGVGAGACFGLSGEGMTSVHWLFFTFLFMLPVMVMAST